MSAVADSRLLDSTAAFLDRSVHQAWVGGGPLESDGELLDDIDPATGRLIGRVVTSTTSDGDRAVAAARAAFTRWAKTPPAERSRNLVRLAEAVEADRELLAQLETLDTGKPIREARGDIARALDGLFFYAGCARQIRGETIEIDDRFGVFTLRRPLGVVLAIVPWNVPFVLTICKVGPALASGNAVIVKPAEATPLTALRLAELCAAAGLPDGLLNVLPGSGKSLGSYLVAHPGIDKVTFTGSTAVGIEISRIAAGRVKSVALELGGKSPNIVFADADLDAAGKAAAAAIFYGQGEICSAGSRLLVERSVFDEVVGRVVDHAAALRLGDPFDDATELGSLISNDHLEKVVGAVERAAADGAEVMAGGGRSARPELAAGAFMDATVVGPTRADMEVEREEIFGPVLAAAPFDSEEEAIARANNSVYGLSAAVWTEDSRRGRRLVEALESGVVWVNGYNEFDAAAPFGGVKLSGNTREWSHLAMDSFSQVKTVWERR
jgi:acyl-CoA reductase-like NAD-dependent aldehyde dehydrogenase